MFFSEKVPLPNTSNLKKGPLSYTWSPKRYPFPIPRAQKGTPSPYLEPQKVPLSYTWSPKRYPFPIPRAPKGTPSPYLEPKKVPLPHT